jgi:transcriptional regulator with GAF, ATPase, and Fis domain
MTSKKAKQSRAAAKDDSLNEIARIERDQAHLWASVLTVLMITPLILGTAIVFLRRFGTAVPWPWPHTDVTLLGGLIVAAFAFSIYASVRHRRFRRRRNEIVRGQKQILSNFERYYNQLIELNKVSRTMASKTTPQSLFNRITQICFETFDCERVSIMAVDTDKKELTVRSAAGHGNMDLVMGSRQGVGDGVAGWVAEHRRPLLLGPQVNASKFWRFRPKSEQIYSAMVVPVVFREQLYGVLCVSSRNAEVTYTQEDLRVLEVMAWNAAVCVRHIELLGIPLAHEHDGQEDAEKKSA